jgi:hypothetical protein
MGGQAVDHRRQMERRLADPAGQRRSVEAETRPAHDLALAVERRMVGVFGDQHMRDGALGRQGALDQPRVRRCLDDPGLAGRTGIARPHRRDHPELRRHDVEAFRAVLADLHHLAAAAGAERAVGLDHHFAARQLPGQPAEIALGAGGGPGP